MGAPSAHWAQQCPPTPPQGNLFDFLRLTEWRGPRVLYFGDHLYSDLAVRGQGWAAAGREGALRRVLSPALHPAHQDLMLRHGWRTGAIIPELEREIRIINTEQYMHSLTWQQALTGLLERMQVWGWLGCPGADGGGHLGCRMGHAPSTPLVAPRRTRTQSHGRCWRPG